jgi:hypothetical protein
MTVYGACVSCVWEQQPACLSSNADQQRFGGSSGGQLRGTLQMPKSSGNSNSIVSR